MMLIMWAVGVEGSAVTLTDVPLSWKVCWMSARTVWVKLDCWVAVGVPPNAWMTAGLLYQACGLPVVRVLASA